MNIPQDEKNLPRKGNCTRLFADIVRLTPEEFEQLF